MFGDTEYYIRDMGWCYEVAKFEGGKSPVAIYRVITAREGEWCSCPARTGYCKHWRMVEEWKRLGKPWMAVFGPDGEILN